MALLLDAGLKVRHFTEPAPQPGGAPAQSERNRRIPWFNIGMAEVRLIQRAASTGCRVC